MRLNVAAELRLPGSTGSVHKAFQQENMEFNQRAVAFAAPFTIDASYVFDGSGFNVTGSLNTVLCAQCALCAKNFEEPFGFEFDERFEKEPSEESDAYCFSGDELDLSQMVRDNIFLHLPINSVCSEDCKGLCPRCGCDLNTAQCSCEKEEAPQAGPLSALGALLNEDKEV